MVTILGIFSYGLLLLFGVLSSLHFCGVEDSQPTRLGTLVFVLFCSLLQLICWFFFGLNVTAKLYPLIAHLPLVLFLIFFCRRPPLLSVVSVLSAYLCCQIARWFATAALYLSGSKVVYYLVDILILLPLYLLLVKYAATSIYHLMNLSRKSLLLFGVMPLFYYIFDYVTTVYTDALYSGIRLVVEFMPSMVCFFYLAFAVIYYSELNRRSESEHDKQLLSLQLKASRLQLEELAEQQEQARCYRHDVRHHLSLIGGYLSAGDTARIRQYLLEVQRDIDAITPVRYCENETANLIFSSFAAKAIEAGGTLRVEAVLPSVLPVGDTDLCALLSNALENAVNAVKGVEDRRTICILCRLADGKFLLSVSNPYVGEVLMENGLPRSRRENHGFGVKSITSIAEKHGGLCDFTARDGMFILRVVL